MGSEVMLGREPANVADLAEKPGGHHRPHPEPPEQAGVGLDDGCLGTGLHRGDPLLQLADVGDQVRSQLVADDAGWPAGVTAANSAAARLAVRLRRAPPGTRSIGSRCSRLMVWVRAATRSWRRLAKAERLAGAVEEALASRPRATRSPLRCSSEPPQLGQTDSLMCSFEM